MDEKNLYLYRLEAEMGDGPLLTVVVAAETEEEAFKYAENRLLQYTVARPDVRRWSLLEKKPLRKGAGYVVPAGPEEWTPARKGDADEPGGVEL